MLLKESNKIEDCIYVATWENNLSFCNPKI